MTECTLYFYGHSDSESKAIIAILTKFHIRHQWTSNYKIEAVFIDQAIMVEPIAEMRKQNLQPTITLFP